MGRKQHELWVATAEIPAQAEGPMLELLGARFGASVTSYSNLELGRTSVSVFLKDPSEWTAETARELSRIWPQMQPGTPFPAFQTTRVRQQDWAESWKQHFKRIRIGTALEVRPPWIRKAIPSGCKVLVLEPGLSFGTGQHPTTSFCLREVVRLRRKGGSFLDAGTGSGILSIAAAKLGYFPVHAFDIDPDAIRVARENARRNHVSDHVKFAVRDLARLPAIRQKYDLVCANLISTVLIEHKERLVSMLNPGGVIVLAGILATEFSHIQRAFELSGLRLVRSSTQKEWRSGSFRLEGSA